MAYVKLDTGILNSTLWVDRDAREIFLTALLMAEPYEVLEPMPQLEVASLETTGFCVPPGWYGFVSAAGVGIVRRAMLEQDAGLEALARLGVPEVESRSRDFDGRRLVRVNGGYIVLNFFKYRDRDHTAATRSQRYRDRKKAATRDDVDATRDVTYRDRSVTEAVGSRQEAEAVSSSSSSPDLSAHFPNSDQREAYATARRAASLPAKFDAVLRTIHDPPSGGGRYDWPIIGQAILEIQATAGRMTANSLRAFCRKLTEQPANGLGRKGGATGDGIDWDNVKDPGPIFGGR